MHFPLEAGLLSTLTRVIHGFVQPWLQNLQQWTSPNLSGHLFQCFTAYLVK